ncbi:MAG: hypothetical protein LBI09_00435 [Nitrososphaerota archaeon]|nr:hypothetical protein [Nitrososphaerota archaeon]
MEKHKSTCQLLFEDLTENNFLTVNMSNVNFHVTYMYPLRTISLNIRQVYTSYRNFNVAYNYYDEAYGTENVEFGGLT